MIKANKLLLYEWDGTFWREVGGSIREQAREYSSWVALEGKLWVVGGLADGYRYLKSVEVYDPVTREWSEGPA